MWTRYTDFRVSEDAQKYRPSFRMKKKRPVQLHKGHERGLRVKNQALLVEHTIANKPSGETDFLASDDQVWIRHHSHPRSDFYMPSGEQGAPRTQELPPFKMTRVDPASGDDSKNEPFDSWTESIDSQHPSYKIESKAGGPGPGSLFFQMTPDLQDMRTRPRRALHHRSSPSRRLRLSAWPTSHTRDGVACASGRRARRALTLPLPIGFPSFRWSSPSLDHGTKTSLPLSSQRKTLGPRCRRLRSLPPKA